MGSLKGSDKGVYIYKGFGNYCYRGRNDSNRSPSKVPKGIKGSGIIKGP